MFTSSFYLILIGIVLIFSLSIAMAKLQNKIKRITVILFIPTVLCGMILYLIGYFPQTGGFKEYSNALLRALFSSGRMFLINDDYSIISELANSSIVKSIYYQVAFWSCHVIALVILVMTVFSVFGRELLSNLKMLLKFNKDKYIIIGINDRSLCLARNIMTNDNMFQKNIGSKCIIFIDECTDEAAKDRVLEIGGLLIKEPVFASDSINKKALKKAGLKKSRIFHKSLYVFAFTDDDIFNSTATIGIIKMADSEMISENCLKGIFVQSESEIVTSRIEALLLKHLHKYNINFFSENDLAARIFVELLPIHNRLVIDEKKACIRKGSRNLYKIMILGFGQTGRHILRKALCNGQFEGGMFEAIVVDKGINDIEGQFKNNYPALFDGSMINTDISFVQADVCSSSFYELLEKNIGSVDHVIINLGNDLLNFETLNDINRFIIRRKMEKPPIIAAHISHKKYKLFNCSNENNSGNIYMFGDYNEIFTERIIIHEGMDVMAKFVDKQYGGRNWNALTVHAKNSNRAAAAFMGAFLSLMGLELKSEKELSAADMNLSMEAFKSMLKDEIVLENLARTEHMRWNAFHFTNGWTTKPLEELTDRYSRIDQHNRTHACLVSWEQLETVRHRITGYLQKLDEEDLQRMGKSRADMGKEIERCDFQSMDRKNINILYDIVNEYNKIHISDKLYIVKKESA